LGDFIAAVGGASENDNLIQFGNPTAGAFPITVTHVALGAAASGAGTVIEFTALNSPLVINANVQPQFADGTLDFNLV